MKQIIEHVIILALVAAILFPSCNKQMRTPCNPHLEEWTQNNIIRFKSASPDEFLSLPLDKQRAMFSLLPAEKQNEIWQIRLKKEKLNSGLSGEELQDYLTFLEGLRPYDFSAAGEKQCLKKSETFLKYMKEKYQWDERKEFFYLHTWLTEEEYSDAIMLQLLSAANNARSRMTRGGIDSTELADTLAVDDSLIVVEPPLPDCECIYDVGCGIGTMRTCDKALPCEPVQHCGIIPNHSYCTGRCM